MPGSMLSMCVQVGLSARAVRVWVGRCVGSSLVILQPSRVQATVANRQWKELKV